MRNRKLRNLERIIKQLNLELPNGSLLKPFTEGLLNGYNSVEETDAISVSDLSLIKSDVANKVRRYNQNKIQYNLEVGHAVGKLIAYTENLKIIKLAEQQKEYKTA